MSPCPRRRSDHTFGQSSDVVSLSWRGGLQDKINSFWEISKKELEDKKAELRNKEREMEELEERHQVQQTSFNGDRYVTWLRRSGFLPLDSTAPLDVSQVELKVYKQKVKHLLYEHQNNITALKVREGCSPSPSHEISAASPFAARH